MDEREKQDHFIHLMGGTNKSDNIQYIWNNSYPCDMRPQGKLHTREQIFRKRAKDEGYTDEQIDYFLNL